MAPMNTEETAKLRISAFRTGSSHNSQRGVHEDHLKEEQHHHTDIVAGALRKNRA